MDINARKVFSTSAATPANLTMFANALWTKISSRKFVGVQEIEPNRRVLFTGEKIVKKGATPTLLEVLNNAEKVDETGRISVALKLWYTIC